MCGMFTEIFGISFAIYITDMLLRPRFQTGTVEIVLFAVMGGVAYIVYHYLKCNSDGQMNSEPASMAPGKMLLGAGIGAMVLYFTDIMLRIDAFQGFSNELFKFLIQGSILWFTYSSFTAAIMNSNGY